MSLTVTSIVTVVTIVAALYFTVAQADEKLPVKARASSSSSSSSSTSTSSSTSSGGGSKLAAAATAAKGKRGSLLAPHRQRRESSLSIMIPGTKWCGKGNSALHDDDLGTFMTEDSCCRTHDKCQRFITSGETRYYSTSDNVTYPIHNEHIYTISACECDEAFKQCLHDADSEKADEIGMWFFNWFHPFCLAFDHPWVCVSRMFMYWGPCNQKEPDPSQEKRWYLKEAQFFEIAGTRRPKCTNRGNDVDDLDCEPTTSSAPTTVDEFGTADSTFGADSTTSSSTLSTTARYDSTARFEDVTKMTSSSSYPHGEESSTKTVVADTSSTTIAAPTTTAAATTKTVDETSSSTSTASPQAASTSTKKGHAAPADPWSFNSVLPSAGKTTEKPNSSSKSSSSSSSTTNSISKLTSPSTTSSSNAPVEGASAASTCKGVVSKVMTISLLIFTFLVSSSSFSS